MAQRNFTRNMLTLIGIGLLMTACSGGTPNEVSSQAIEPTPTLVVVGSTIDKPVPYGYDIILKNVVLSINEINRPANDTVTQSNDKTPAPDSGQEYLLIRITSQCIVTESPSCFVGHSDFQIIDTEGNAVAPVSETSGADGFYTYEEFLRGTSNKGFLAFLVDQDVDYPILTYNSFHKGKVYLSLEY